MQAGQRLETLDGSIVGNAIIAGLFRHRDSKEVIYWVMTDFGNSLWLTEQEIHDWFGLGPMGDVGQWARDRRNLQNKTTVQPDYLEMDETLWSPFKN